MAINRRFLYAGLFLVALGGVVVLAELATIDPSALASALRLWPLAWIALGAGIALRRSRVALVAGIVAAMIPGLVLGGFAVAAPRHGLDCASGTGGTETRTQGGAARASSADTPRMPSHRLTAFAAAPPERVFELWIDLERMKEWVQGVTRVSDVSGPVDRAGTSYVVWFGKVRSPTVVLEADRPRRFSTRFGSWILRGVNTTMFEPEGEGTRINEVMQTEGWVSEITSRLFSMGSYRGSYQGELNDFARLAEREAGRPGGSESAPGS